MSKVKGTPKTGGRGKGTPNKATSEIRLWLSGLIEDNLEQIEADLKALEPKDRLLILEKFMQYTIPKMQSLNTSLDIDGKPEGIDKIEVVVINSREELDKIRIKEAMENKRRLNAESSYPIG